MTATAYIEDDTPNGTMVNGAYFFSHDNTYRPQHCFHITVSWIFANGPQIMEKINSLKRKVKSCGLQIIPISGVVNKDELNPFENFTRLKIVKSEPIGSQRESSVGRGSGSAKNAGGTNSLYPYNTHKLSLDSTSYYFDEENSIPRNLYAEHLKEKRCTMFIRRFEYFLRSYYGFVIESENKIYRNYIHFSGIAVIRIFHNSEVAWIENDVVNNQMADYSESHRVQEKVDVLIFSIDLILDMVFEKILLTEEETASKGEWKAEQEL
ncbi:hypothetical protein FGO68_gene12580 [Halteria grandinella]|uniref:Uncharacterized protein n=1 Tax=Halteria grandinella TaxID=5974 RepID=A0A8J8T9P4_HALGN|nr:hypothetical protein FGO68_gene12580 [Halteria grandinella]